MQSEFSGYIRQAIERLLQQMEEMERRQKALEDLTERITAEQEELRRRQDAQSQEWENFGRRWKTYFADWEVRLGLQTQQLEGFTKQLAEWEGRLNTHLEVLNEFTKQFSEFIRLEEY